MMQPQDQDSAEGTSHPRDDFVSFGAGLLIRQELKFLAHSKSRLTPTVEPVKTGFRYEAGI
jgi:hypothetical protein